MTVRSVIGACAIVLFSIGGVAAQAPSLRSSAPVDAGAVEADPAAQAVRASYGACRPTTVQRLTVSLDRGPDAGTGGDLVALIDADCRRGPTQFLYIGLDAGQATPDEVLLLLLPRPTYQSIAVDPATRRMFGRTARGFEEIAWQRLTRDHLFRLRKPLREYAGLILPPVPGGPVPALPAQAEATPAAPAAPTAPAPAAAAPVADAARARAELEAEIRAAIEPQLRQQVSAEIRQEIGAEVQARLDRARGIVEGLQRELEAERATLARERAARETAERLLGLAQAAERDREARAAAERALAEARATAEQALANARAAAERDLAEARAQTARAEAEAARLRSEAEARAAAAPATSSTTTQQ